MNWLAHTFLSEPNVQFQLGNLLADLVRGPQREQMGADFRRGADCHKIIDAFTDSHPLVRRSRAQVPARTRYTGDSRGFNPRRSWKASVTFATLSTMLSLEIAS